MAGSRLVLASHRAWRFLCGWLERVPDRAGIVVASYQGVELIGITAGEARIRR